MLPVVARYFLGKNGNSEKLPFSPKDSPSGLDGQSSVIDLG
jgi:hypothetical protein